MSEQESTLDEFVDESENDTVSEDTEISSERLENHISIIKGTKPDRVENTPSEASEPYLIVDTLTGEDRKYTPDTDGPEATAKDTLMIMDGSKSGRVYEGEPGIIGSTMAAIRPDEIEPTYLRYFLEANFERLNAATKGSAVPHTDKDLLRGLEVPSYRYNEQRKIASVLYTVDQAIQRTEEIIKQIDTVRKGLIQDLLTGEFNNEKEKTSRVGPKEVEIPNNWVIKRVSDISNIKNGNRIVKGHEYSDGTTDYPFIRIVDMENGTVSTEDINYLKEETAKQMQRGIISSDDVYITVTGRVGDAGTIPPELDGARFTDNAAKLYDLEGVIPEYLSLYLRSKFGQDEVHRFTVGSTQPKLSMYRVEKMEVIVPPIDEQEEIVTHVSSIDETRFQNAKIKGKLQRLKQGLMQDLLSGEVRTHDKEIELVEDVLQHG
jgi:type I restriction enzyme S subunit